MWWEIQGVGLCGVLSDVGCVGWPWGSGSFQMLSIQTQTVKEPTFVKILLRSEKFLSVSVTVFYLHTRLSGLIYTASNS